MTIEEAIKWYESKVHVIETLELSDVQLEAAQMALDALRAKQETEKNEPLTIPELLQMDIQPVWVVNNDGNGEWKLVDVENKLLYGVGEDYEIIYCGTEYTAYRHPPKEAHDA